jgi:hypothetical protein
METINKEKLQVPLFVINTGGNHMPLKRQYKIQKKIMENKFNNHNKYEIYITKKKIYNIVILYANIIIIFIKIISNQEAILFILFLFKNC